MIKDYFYDILLFSQNKHSHGEKRKNILQYVVTHIHNGSIWVKQSSIILLKFVHWDVKTNLAGAYRNNN